MATLGEIETLTKEYAASRERLRITVRELQDRVEATRRQYLPGIKKQVGIAKEKRERLHAAIDDSPALFTKPKSFIFHGVRVGLKKAKGLIEWASEEAVIKLIKRHLADQADLLIKTTEKVLKKPLGQLPAADLKKIGVTIQDTGDVAIIEPTDSEVDKLVEALLDENKGEEEAA